MSPEPAVNHYDLDNDEDAFIIIASDGLWGVMKAPEAVEIVSAAEKKNSKGHHSTSSSSSHKSSFR